MIDMRFFAVCITAIVGLWVLAEVLDAIAKMGV